MIDESKLYGAVCEMARFVACLARIAQARMATCAPEVDMKLPAPLIAGIFRQRYKRFFTDIELADGSLVVAHTPNTGASWSSGADFPDR